MKEDNSDSPFIEEMIGADVSAQPTNGPDEPATPVVPEDKSVRLEAEIRYLRDLAEESAAAVTVLKKQTGRLVLAGWLLAGLCGLAMLQLASRMEKQSAELKTASIAPEKNIPNPVPDRSLHISSVTFFHWEQGQPPVKLIGRNEGICVLTKVTGRFDGGGESVRLWIDKDGYWYLGGESHQQGIGAECAVLKY